MRLRDHRSVAVRQQHFVERIERRGVEDRIEQTIQIDLPKRCAQRSMRFLRECRLHHLSIGLFFFLVFFAEGAVVDVDPMRFVARDDRGLEFLHVRRVRETISDLGDVGGRLFLVRLILRVRERFEFAKVEIDLFHQIAVAQRAAHARSGVTQLREILHIAGVAREGVIDLNGGAGEQTEIALDEVVRFVANVEEVREADDGEGADGEKQRQR